LPIENTVFAKKLIIPVDLEQLKKYRYASRARKIEINNFLIARVLRYSARLEVDDIERMFVKCESIYEKSRKGHRARPRAKFLQVRRLQQLLTASNPIRPFVLYRCKKLIQEPLVHPGNQYPIIRDRDGCMYPSRAGQFILTDNGDWMVVLNGFNELRLINRRLVRDRTYHCSPVFRDDGCYVNDIMAEQIELVTNNDPRIVDIKKLGSEPPHPSQFEGYTTDVSASRIVRVSNYRPEKQDGRIVMFAGNRMPDDEEYDPDDLENCYI